MKMLHSLAILLVLMLSACGQTSAALDTDIAAVGDADAAADVTADVPAYKPDLPALVLGGDPTTAVDPRIGTDGSGNVFFGVTLPHGMVKLGPDTDNGTQDIKGYQWNAQKIQTFSHTHLDGPGGSAYGYSQIALMPTMGTRTVQEEEYAATYDRATQIATPGRYAVKLPEHDIAVELAATRHCGWHKYQFPAGTARVLVDFGHTRGKSVGGQVQVAGDTVSGRGDYNVHPAISGLLQDKKPIVGLSSIYAHVRFSTPPTASGVWQGRKEVAGTLADGADSGAWLEWQSATPQTIHAMVCLSLISDALAQKHLQDEMTTATFAGVVAAAHAEWNGLLSRIQVETVDAVERTRFYTAVYHAMLQPADYTEDGQFWNGSKEVAQVQSTGGKHFYTDDWCVWDTTRTVHPLLTLIQPEVVGDMLQSLVWMTGPEGYLPKCPWQATGDSRVMTGNFTFCVMADAVVKGLTDFDTAAAMATMQHGAMTDSVNPYQDGVCGYFNQGSPPFYVQNGWVPQECDLTQGASMTLEHSYSDWCLGQYAQALGNADLAKQMAPRGNNWQNTWGPHGYPQLRAEDGTWLEPFDPAGAVGFTEATAWIYEWLVPQDRCGLVAKIGGRAATLQRLNDFFDGGHFDMGNEPDFHAPWLYVDVGRPDLASDRVHKLLAAQFNATPGGLPGNDDAGAMSGWLVFATLGLYPVAPGDGYYTLTAPLFARAEINVGGKIVRVEAPGAPTATHIVSAKWNGQPLTEPRIAHSALAQGGFLELTLTPGDSAWGANACP